MSKILVVTYSFTGTCRSLAQRLGTWTQWPLAEILDVHPRRGFWALWRCMWDSILRRQPPIHYLGPDVSEFDAVVLISPIWALRLAGPMRSFLATYKDKLQDVIVISVMDSRGHTNAVAEVEQLRGKASLLHTAFTTQEIEDGNASAHLQAFAKAIEEAEDNSMVHRPPVWTPQTA